MKWVGIGIGGLIGIIVLLTLIGMIATAVNSTGREEANTEPKQSGRMILIEGEDEGIIPMGIPPGGKVYDEIKAFLGGAGRHVVSAEKYNEINAIIEKHANANSGNSSRPPIFNPGMDPNAKDDIGKTLLHEAAKTRRLDDARRLIEAGANVNAQIIDRTTPLHNAALNGGSNGGPEMVQLLIDAGADVNAVGFQGMTPLHAAIKAPGDNTRQVIELLLAAGASESIPDANGKLPIDYAQENAPELVDSFGNEETSYQGVMSEKSSLDDWTLDEMADCAGTVEKLRPDVPTPEHADILFESCKAAMVMKQLETMKAIRENLSGLERREILAHVNNIEKISDSVEELIDDGVIDEQEADWMCSVLPQWIAQANQADNFVESLGRTDLVGIEIDMKRLRNFTEGAQSSCNES